MNASDAWVQRLTSPEPERGIALAELRDLLQRGLSRALNNRHGQPFHADDILQEALIRILDSLDQFQGRSQFIVWAMAIATRTGISALRRSYSRDVSLDALDSDDCLRILSDPVCIEPNNEVERREVLDCLNRLIDAELTPRQRLAIRAMLENVAIDELALKLGSQRNSVYKLVHDARMKLKHGLLRHGYTADHVKHLFQEGSRKWH